MTDLDDRVRSLLERRARDVAIDPAMPAKVASRSRRRRALVGAGGGLAALALIVGGAAALRTTPPQPEPGGRPTPTPAPSTFVGIRDRRILLVDAGTGEPIRVLVDRPDLGGGGGGLDLEVSPDGTEVYFVPSGTPELIMRAPIDGGEPTLVAKGRKPTISPDGRSLAYVDCSSPFTGCGNAIEVLDLESGDSRTWDVGGRDRWVGQLAWLPGGRTLAYSVFHAGDGNPTAHVLDTADAGDVALGDVPAIGPDRPGAGWTVVGSHTPSGGLAVRHSCCSSGATDEVEESAVLAVAPDGRVLGTVFEGANWLDIELDASGHHFLLVDQGLDVYRLDGSGRPVLVAGGFEDVDW
jgi:WD40 repeat protein